MPRRRRNHQRSRSRHRSIIDAALELFGSRWSVQRVEDWFVDQAKAAIARA